MRESRAEYLRKILAVTAAAAAAVFLWTAVPSAGLSAQAAKASKAKKTSTTVTAVAAAGPSAASAQISGSNVVVTTTGTFTSEDGIVHLFAQQPYETGVQGTEIAQAGAGTGVKFSFALGKNTANSNLFRKYQCAVVKGGVLTPVGNAKYIVNPEAAATHTAARNDHGKKGLLPASELLGDLSQLKALGIQQITYNLPVGDLCSGGGVDYTYNGKTYSFNAGIVGQYDSLVPKMNQNGIQVTLILLNNWKGDATLIHPLSRDFTGANYYAFDTADQAGVEKLEAVASFLAQRYSGNGHGTVDNWIVGNEINARQEWNYMTAGAGIDTFAAEYAKALRIVYNGIRSENANARVYAAYDHEWASSDNAALHYAGQQVLARMAADISAEGNIAYGISCHPYNALLTDPITWSGNLTPHSQNARFVSMYNIDVLTDYLSQASMLAPDGQVRSVLCSEVGYNSLQGQQYQAAAVVLGYEQAVNNQHIDGFILNRQMDHVSEVAQGLLFGLKNPDGSNKLAYSWYQSVDSPDIQAQAAQVIGVTSLSQAITAR